MSHPNIRLVKKPAPTDTPADLERAALQRLANAVVDEAHWQDVLGSAYDAETRAELERVVGPMLKFRRGAVCTTPDCGSGEHGIWQPVLVCRSATAPEQDSAWVPIELRLCDTCKASATLEDFLTEDIWRQTLSQWTAEWPPTRHLTTLSWDRVH